MLNHSTVQFSNHTIAPLNYTPEGITLPASKQVPLCPRSGGEICGPLGWEFMVVFVNCVGILVNIMHLVILARLDSLRGTRYLIVLQQIAVADIFCSIGNAVRLMCPVHVSSRHLAAGIFVSSMSDALAGWRYYIVGFACIERYMAVCKPFFYNGHFVVTNIGKLMWISFVFCLGNSFARDMIFQDELCLDTALGASNTYEHLPAAMYTIAVGAAPLIVSAVLSVFILIELQKMRKRNLSDKQKEVNNAAVYILITNFVLVACLLPFLLDFGLTALTTVYVETHLLSWISILAFGLYGTANTVVYGWRNKAYINKAKSLFGIKPSDVSYSIENGGTGTTS